MRPISSNQIKVQQKKADLPSRKNSRPIADLSCRAHQRRVLCRGEEGRPRCSQSLCLISSACDCEQRKWKSHERSTIHCILFMAYERNTCIVSLSWILHFMMNPNTNILTMHIFIWPSSFLVPEKKNREKEFR